MKSQTVPALEPWANALRANAAGHEVTFGLDRTLPSNVRGTVSRQYIEVHEHGYGYAIILSKNKIYWPTNDTPRIIVANDYLSLPYFLCSGEFKLVWSLLAGRFYCERRELATGQRYSLCLARGLRGDDSLTITVVQGFAKTLETAGPIRSQRTVAVALYTEQLVCIITSREAVDISPADATAIIRHLVAVAEALW